MGVMFKTLNMMEEFHVTQLNEIRDQMSVISTTNNDANQKPKIDIVKP